MFYDMRLKDFCYAVLLYCTICILMYTKDFVDFVDRYRRKRRVDR